MLKANLNERQLAALRRLYDMAQAHPQWRFSAKELGVHRSTMVALLHRRLADNVYAVRHLHNTYRITDAGIQAVRP